ncbi:MAG: hypothetical protein JOY53_00665 [Acidobacteriaceae bacterium]|nr:hypothetical protein [Acidobacteriaceae bacterium]
MVKVSIEVHHGTARFMVAVTAQSIQQAMKIVQARYPSSVARVKLPIEPEGFFVEDRAA